jgi:hypothetical protein
MEQDSGLRGTFREQRGDPADMVDVKMGGGDDPNCHERALQGADTEFLNGIGGADAAAIYNHQTVMLIL